MKEQNLWYKLSSFLEEFNLIPLVLIVSVYHYFQALRTHDPFLVAVPIALFVDLLHYRSVQQAVTRRGWWQLIAIVTTAVAFGMQLMFYTQSGVEGTELLPWQSVMFSAVVPVGVAIMAYHAAVLESDKILTVVERETAVDEREAELDECEAAVNQCEDELNGRESRLNGREAALNQREDALNKCESELHDRETAVAAFEKRMYEINRKLAEYEAQLKVMNPLARDVVAMMAGNEDTGQAIASRYDVSTGYVSGLKSKLNGYNGSAKQ